MKFKVPIEKIKIEHAGDIYQIMQLVLQREEKVRPGREHFWVIALNNGNRIINLEHISRGNVKNIIVEPMEVLSIPLQNSMVKPNIKPFIFYGSSMSRHWLSPLVW